MTERATKTNARVGAAFDQIGADMSDEVAQLQRSLDEVRGSVASLAARIGDGAVTARDRGMRQARELAGEFADDFADHAGEGAAVLRGRIEDQPLASMALTFFGGVVAGVAVGLLIGSGSGARPRHR